MEFEAIEDILGELLGSIGEEEIGGDAALRESEEEIEDAKSEKSAFSKVLDAIKRFKIPPEVKAFVKAVADNVFVCMFLNLLNVNQAQLMFELKHLELQSMKLKKAKTKAMAVLQKHLNKILEKIAIWKTAGHGQDVIDAGAGLLVVTLGDLLTQFTYKMEKPMNDSCKITKSLTKRNSSGKITGYETPSSDQMNELIKNSETIIDLLEKMVDFIKKDETTNPDLKTLDVKQDDIDNLKDQLKKVKDLPFGL